MTDSDVLLEAADRLLTEVVPGTRGLWPRIVALVVRAALEQELDTFWLRMEPSIAQASTRAQLLLLTEFAGVETARDAADAWHGLSRASHHHAYELAPEAGELRTWLITVERVKLALAAVPPLCP
jgi:hypothetical protein